MTLTLSVLSGLFLLASSSGVLLLLRLIRHPSLDTISLFRLARSMTGSNRLDQNCVELYLNGDDDTFRTGLTFTAHNIFLNIVRHLPPTRWFTGMQHINLWLFAGTLVCLATYQVRLSLNLGSLAETALIGALPFTLLAAARTRLLLVATLALSDVINYFCFAAAVLCLLETSLSQSTAAAAIAGAFIGLAVRNKSHDILLFLAGLLYLLLVERSFPFTAAYCAAFFVITFDIVKNEFFSRKNSYRTFYIYSKVFGPRFSKRGASVSRTPNGSPTSVAWRGLKTMLNPYADDSLWPSIGILLPTSILAMAELWRQSMFPRPLLFFAIYVALFCGSLLFMRHRFQLDGKLIERWYYSGRQSYVLIPALIPLNGIAMTAALMAKNHSLVIFTALLLAASALHQLYRLADYLLQDTVRESHLIEYKKAPEPWRMELSEFLADLEEPSVVLGDHFLYGKAYDFYHWHQGRRCVDTHRPIPDHELVVLIRRYGITHIVVTPFSCLRHPDSGLGNEQLSPALDAVLCRIPAESPNLILYRVKHSR